MPIVRSLPALLLSWLVLAACGDDLEGDDDICAAADALADRDILERLRALPHVASIEERSADGHRYFYIGFDQPVDHGDPEGQHFTQYLTLRHVDERGPLVLGTTGYANFYLDFPMEPTLLMDANQIVIEHRYFLPSRPQPTDWSHLRVVQSADDHHEIARAFHCVYDGPWVSTGASKGGMTSIYHRHLYPDDVDATVAYVAPDSHADGDIRYDAWFDEVLPASCLERVRALQVDILTNRRAAMVERAVLQEEADAEFPITYTRVAIEVAVESAVAGIEWSFFQYVGVGACDDEEHPYYLPDASASDDEVWDWLRRVSRPDSLSDESLAALEPYYYQAYAELGYPSTEDPHLEKLLEFGPEDYAGTDPPVVPSYDPAAVFAAASWVREDAERVLFLYGQYDPWTAGAFDLGSNRSVARYVVPAGTHGSAIGDLPDADETDALAALEDWTGVQPSLMVAFRALWRLAQPAEEPRLPIHALHMSRGGR